MRSARPAVGVAKVERPRLDAGDEGRLLQDVAQPALADVGIQPQRADARLDVPRHAEPPQQWSDVDVVAGDPEGSGGRVAARVERERTGQRIALRAQRERRGRDLAAPHPPLEDHVRELEPQAVDALHPQRHVRVGEVQRLGQDRELEDRGALRRSERGPQRLQLRRGEQLGDEVRLHERLPPDRSPGHVPGDRRAADEERTAGERRVAPPHLYGPFQRDARIARRRETQPRRELPGARRGDVECDFGPRRVGRFGERARQARAYAPARPFEGERRAPIAQDPLDRAGPERPGERLAAQAAAQPARDRLAARLRHLGRIELHRHRPAARVVAVGEPRSLDRDPRREVADELAGAVAGGLQRYFEPAHAPRHVRCVEHQLGETAERRLARDEVGAQARRRGRAVGGDLAFEPRAADRHGERRRELAGLDAEAGAQVAQLARHARPVRDAQLDVRIEQRQPLQLEIGPLELAERFGQRLDLLGRAGGCAGGKRAQVERGRREPASELRAWAARVEGEIACNRGGTDHAIDRPQRGRPGRHVELARDRRRANRGQAHAEQPLDLARVCRAGAECRSQGGGVERAAQGPAGVQHRAGEGKSDVKRPGVGAAERRQRPGGRIGRVRQLLVHHPACGELEGLARPRVAGELGELEAAGGARADVVDHDVFEGDAVNVQPRKVGGRARRRVRGARAEDPVAASVARAREPDGDVATVQLADPGLTAQQREELHAQAELADASKVGRVEARRVRDADIADAEVGAERQGQPRGPVEAHLAAERARKRRRDRLAPALRVDPDADERDRGEGEDAERDERGEELGGKTERQVAGSGGRRRRRDSIVHAANRPPGATGSSADAPAAPMHPPPPMHAPPRCIRHPMHRPPGARAAPDRAPQDRSAFDPSDTRPGPPRDATICRHRSASKAVILLHCNARQSLTASVFKGFAQPENP